ncbi:hypothetical protein L665_01317 [Ralstonia solanacearum SD54]|nr:hypothetical protein F504_1706 [Ralstonia pseudosolanacearum FQY_4]ANH32972.1 hypothetical protein A3768_1820 [Ralstonia solanacearum]ARU21134.1 cell division inhibitor MinD [Ralstonia solanacearum]ESS49992.1 hypothetical protein L665_01317 [Ralstonia solanacearum SD54]
MPRWLGLGSGCMGRCLVTRCHSVLDAGDDADPAEYRASVAVLRGIVASRFHGCQSDGAGHPLQREHWRGFRADTPSRPPRNG